MDSLESSQTILINSAKRTNGDVANYQVHLPSNAVKCREDQLMAIAVTSLSFFMSDFVLQGSSFTCTRVRDQVTTTCTLPYGTYTFAKLAIVITGILPEGQCNYLPQQNALQFIFPSNYTVTFSDSTNVWPASLGLPQHIFNSTSFIGQPMNPWQRLQHICVHVENVLPAGYNLTNFVSTGDMLESSTVAAVVHTDPTPFSLVTWTGDNNFYIKDQSLNVLVLKFTDIDGNSLSDLLPEHVITLEIRSYAYQDNDETLSVLKEILEIQKLTMLSRHLLPENSFAYE